ncbi:MAG: hypothetical protein RIQ72_260, partial [Candidatus Parcubacteria bacterium]
MTRTLFSHFKTCTVICLLLALLFVHTFAPQKAWAQTSGTTAQAGSGTVNFGIEDQQAAAFQAGQQGQQGQGAGQAVTDIVGSTLSCSAAQILGQLLTTAISSAITSVISGVVGSVAQSAGLTQSTVPTNLKYDEAGQHIVGDVRSKSGSFTMFGIMVNVSWDSIAWCVVNAMIEHIANATIAWANSGFNGNPAFLQNPERFFRDLADYQAGTIIRDIAYGASGGKVNICQPFRVNIAIGLAESYKGSGQNAIDSRYKGMSCSLSDIQQQKFFGGVNVTTGTRRGGPVQNKGVTWSDWLAVSQTDA